MYANLYLRIFDNGSGANRSAAFADRKAHSLFHRNRMDQFAVEFDVIARHHHL